MIEKNHKKLLTKICRKIRIQQATYQWGLSSEICSPSDFTPRGHRRLPATLDPARDRVAHHRPIVVNHILQPTDASGEARNSELRNVLRGDVKERVGLLVADLVLSDVSDTDSEIVGEELLQGLGLIGRAEREGPDADLFKLRFGDIVVHKKEHYAHRSAFGKQYFQKRFAECFVRYCGKEREGGCPPLPRCPPLTCPRNKSPRSPKHHRQVGGLGHTSQSRSSCGGFRAYR